MAEIKLRIEVNPNAETETLGNIVNKVNTSPSNQNLSNTSFKANSSSGIFTLPEDRVNGSNGICFVSDNLIFNSEDNLDNPDGLGGIIEDEENPLEFIWGVVPANKQYSVKLTFTNANALKDIVVYGDAVVGQFPTKAIIDGTTTIYSDDNKWAINLGSESATHTIEFLEWNRTNYNACLSNIRVMLRYLELDKSCIDSLETKTQTLTDVNSIQYGILGNTGSAKIRDLDGELKDLIEDGVIPNSNVPVEIFINGNKIQTHITTDSDYSKTDKMLSLTFSNKLTNLDNLMFEGHQLRAELEPEEISE